MQATGAPGVPRADTHKHLRAFADAEGGAGGTSWGYGRRWGVVALSLAAIGTDVGSLFLDWWKLTLYAPQYPHGLRLTMSLRGMGGDVREIDMLNHYIGMGHLAHAASFEREHAVAGVGVLALMVLALTLLAGRKAGKFIVIPGLAFPTIFLADAYYWMRSFGHNLDPHAPLHIPAFTPQLFGNGQIGQFMTFAVPAAGFWLATSGVLFLAAAVVVRWRVCRECPRAKDCGRLCRAALVGPRLPPKETSR